MNRTSWIVLPVVLAVGMVNVPAMAQEESAPTDTASTVDLETFDCRALLKRSGDERDSAVIFLHGYVSGKMNEMTVDTVALTEATDRVIDRCIDNPQDSALAVFEQSRSPASK